MRFHELHFKHLPVACIVLTLFLYSILPVAAQPALSRGATVHLSHGENRGSAPEHFMVSGDSLYFAADDGIHGKELWRVDSAGRVHLAGDFLPGPEGSVPKSLKDTRLGLFFIAYYQRDHENYDVIININEGIDSAWNVLSQYRFAADSISIAFTNEEIFVFSMPEENSTKLYRYNLVNLHAPKMFGVDSYVLPVGENIYKYDQWFGTIENRLYFVLHGNTNSSRNLYFISNEITEPYRITSVEDASSEQPVFPMNIDIIDGKLYMAASSDIDVELWISQGTWDTNYEVADINPGDESSFPKDFVGYNGDVYFQANDGVHGVELFRTDGTAAGTHIVKDIYPGGADASPYNMCTAGDWLFFTADTDAHGYELWRTDGTAQNTILLADIFPGPEGSNLYQPVAFKDKLFFAANHPDYGEELWCSDGTPEGTCLVKDINPGTGLAEPYSLTVFRDKLYFCANDGRHGEELWCTDGTPEGTVLVADIYPETRTVRSADPVQLTAARDGIYFVADDQIHGAELWWGDAGTGTAARLSDSNPGAKHSDPAEITVFGNTAFYSANDGIHGRELWQATPSGVVLVEDLRTGNAGSVPQHLTAYKDTLYFTAYPEEGNPVIYRMGIHEDRPILLTDIHSLLTGGDVIALHVGRDTLYACLSDASNQRRFARYSDAQNRFELLPPVFSSTPRWSEFVQWAEEDNGALSALLLECYFSLPGMERAYLWHDDVCWFNAFTQEQGAELWRSTGGVLEAERVKDAYPGKAGSSPDEFITQWDRVFYVAEHPSKGRVLWTCGGDTEESYPVGEWITKSTVIEAVRDLAPIGDRILFTRYSYDHSPPVRSLGSCLLYENVPRVIGSPNIYLHSALDPQQLTVVGDGMFFTAVAPGIGRELWWCGSEDHCPKMINLIPEPHYDEPYLISTEKFYHH